MPPEASLRLAASPLGCLHTSLLIKDCELVHSRFRIVGRSAPIGSDVAQRQPNQFGRRLAAGGCAGDAGLIVAASAFRAFQLAKCRLFLIGRTIHVCSVGAGNTAANASGTPSRPGVTAIRMSLQPWVSMSLNTTSQNLALSASLIQSFGSTLDDVFAFVRQHTERARNRFAAHHSVFANL